MEHQSLYRRYRPGRFADVRGQRHVVKALQNAVREGRVGHAYLLSGPRGTGKTTLARILAKVLNCESPVDGEPCCECASCKAIESGTSFDLHELDAASNNKVDDMRDLLGKVALGTPGRTKVYLLDEVHMLSSGAENALLKTLEEPPDHVVFVLATTEPHKVVPTVRSRTQHLELTLLGADEMAEHISWVIADAGLPVDDDVVDYVVRAGGGSVRDTLSALDQVVAAGGVAVDDTSTVELLEALAEHDPGRALTAVAEATRLGRDPRVIGESLLDALRGVFLVAMGATVHHLTDREREQAERFAAQLSPPSITRALELIGSALVDMRQAPDPRVDLEVALVRLTRPATDLSLEALADRLARLERLVAEGGVTAPAAGSSSPPAAPAPPARPASSGGDAPPPRPPRGGPADAARRELSRITGGSSRGAPPRPPRSSRAERAAPPEAPPAAPTPPRAAAEAPRARSAEPAASAAPAAPEPASTGSSPASSGSGPLPSVDELNQAWERVLQPPVAQKIRARYSPGRFVRVTETHAVLAFPNDIHRQRCEEFRAAVEQALAGHFGRPVPLQLTADPSATAVDPAPRSSGRSTPAPEPEPAPDEHIDLDELTDAPAGGGVIEQLTSAFPGAELIDEG